MKWFVYSHDTYYPKAFVIEAESPEAANERMSELSIAAGFHGIAVFPLDALALWTHGRDEPIEEALGLDD